MPLQSITSQISHAVRCLAAVLLCPVICLAAWDTFRSASSASQAATAPAPISPSLPDRTAYWRARQKAHTWLDQLEVDPVELLQHRVKGKKKLAEILDAYFVLSRYASEPAEQTRIRRRVAHLAEHTRRAAYHNMHSNSDREFHQNSMSYFRVLWLLEQFGQETSAYRRHVRKIKPRIDAHLEKRGVWQRAVFADYYEKFNLPRPPILATTLSHVVVAARPPVARYDRKLAYRLTHEIFVAFEYGMRSRQQLFDDADTQYIRLVLPSLAEQALHNHDVDLLAELLSCMTYIGQHTNPAYRQGFTYLLEQQNPDGTWGRYEQLRVLLGQYLDQALYLHTTMVSLRALIEAYEGAWPALSTTMPAP